MSVATDLFGNFRRLVSTHTPPRQNWIQPAVGITSMRTNTRHNGDHAWLLLHEKTAIDPEAATGAFTTALALIDDLPYNGVQLALGADGGAS